MKKGMEKHLTLREKILETIRDAIMSGALKPGEKVAEPELADRFGISRTPIREAFRQLRPQICRPSWVVLIARQGLHGRRMQDAREEAASLLRRAGAFDEAGA